MYPTYNASSEDDGLYGTAGGQPLELVWTGLITFAGEGGGLPTYASADVPTLSAIPAQAETNFLSLRPLQQQVAPPPDLFMNVLIEFKPDAAGVNRAYINGASNPGPSAADLASPPLLQARPVASLPAGYGR